MRRGIVVVSLTLVGVTMGLIIGTRAPVSAEQARPVTPQADVLPALLVEYAAFALRWSRWRLPGPGSSWRLGAFSCRSSGSTTSFGGWMKCVSRSAARRRITITCGRRAACSKGLRSPAAEGPPVEQLKEQQLVVAQQFATAQTTLQRAIADEAAMTSELAAEQARWTDLNQRMEAFEATLGPR